MQVRVGGLVFDDVGSPTFTLEWLSGWEVDGVDMRREGIDRPAAHGSFSAPGFLTARHVSWGGLILTDSAYEQEHARRALSGLLAAGGTDRLVVEWTTAGWADVARDGEPSSKILVPGRIASYAFRAVAVDPRIYGEVREFGAGVPAYQRGNFPAWPTFVVTGASAGGYTITGPGGRRIVVTTPLVAGVPHTIDTAEGEVVAGGTLGNISVFEPWTIGPGIPGVTHAISAGSLLVKVPDANI